MCLDVLALWPPCSHASTVQPHGKGKVKNWLVSSIVSSIVSTLRPGVGKNLIYLSYVFMLLEVSDHISDNVSILELGDWQPKKAQGQHAYTRTFCVFFYMSVDPIWIYDLNPLPFWGWKKKEERSAENRKVTSSPVETFLCASAIGVFSFLWMT